MTSPTTPEPAGAPAPASEDTGQPLPPARESTAYLAGFSHGYRAACAAHGVFDDAVTALAAQHPRQALDVRAARRTAAAARGPEKTPAQLRAEAFASWGLTDHQPGASTHARDANSNEEIGL